MINCAACSKEIKDDCGNFCEMNCGHKFCSYDCAQTEAYEDTFPDCCPGVYWCILCKNEYLDAAKGHLFLIKHHDAHQDLKTYLNLDPENPIFSEACMKCGIWHYQFKSQTDAPGKYENQECTKEFKIKMLNEVERVLLDSIIQCPHCELNGPDIQCINFKQGHYPFTLFADLIKEHYHTANCSPITYLCNNGHEFDIKPLKESCWCGWSPPSEIINYCSMKVSERKPSFFKKLLSMICNNLI